MRNDVERSLNMSYPHKVTKILNSNMAVRTDKEY
jgi:hypothetical protein